MWKAAKIDNYPLKIEKMKQSDEGRISRSVSQGDFREPKTLNTFIGNATRLWNKAPKAIRNAISIKMANKEIKSHFKKYPI